jgi:hypothetical protein
MTTALVVVHAAAVLVLVGVIWTVQLVHYPLLAAIDRAGFAAAHAAHSTRMAAVVALPWALEGGTTLWLLVDPPPGVGRALVVLGAALAVVPVAVTVVASLPAHARLAAGFDADAHRRLVATNWLRTLAWTAHGAVAIAILVAALG